MPNKWQYLGMVSMIFGVMHLADFGIVGIFGKCYTCCMGYDRFEEGTRLERSIIQPDIVEGTPDRMSGKNLTPGRDSLFGMRGSQVHYMDTDNYLLTKSQITPTPGKNMAPKRFDFQEDGPLQSGGSMRNSSVIVEMTNR